MGVGRIDRFVRPKVSTHFHRRECTAQITVRDEHLPNADNQLLSSKFSERSDRQELQDNSNPDPPLQNCTSH